MGTEPDPERIKSSAIFFGSGFGFEFRKKSDTNTDPDSVCMVNIEYKVHVYKSITEMGTEPDPESIFLTPPICGHSTVVINLLQLYPCIRSFDYDRSYLNSTLIVFNRKMAWHTAPLGQNYTVKYDSKNYLRKKILNAEINTVYI